MDEYPFCNRDGTTRLLGLSVRIEHCAHKHNVYDLGVWLRKIIYNADAHPNYGEEAKATDLTRWAVNFLDNFDEIYSKYFNELEWVIEAVEHILDMSIIQGLMFYNCPRKAFYV